MSVARELADLPSASPSTDANFDNGTFVIDVSTDRVGIGTTAPANLFHVVGSADNAVLEGLQLDNTDHASGETAQGIAISFRLSTAGTMADAGRITVGKDDDWDDAAASDGHMTFKTRLSNTLTEYMRIASDGKVGIGTTAPAEHLTVASGDAITRISIRANVEGGASQLDFLPDQGDDNHDNIKIWADENGDLKFSTYSTGSWVDWMHLDNDGKVGIGTTAPASLLDVQGTVQVGGIPDTIAGILSNLQVEGTDAPTSAMSIFRNSNDTASPYLLIGKSRGGAVGADTIVQDNDEVGAIVFTAADGVDRVSRTAEIRSLVGGTPGANDTPGELLFLTTADGAQTCTERMRIMADGKVGIGTSTPIAPFHVFAAADGIAATIFGANSDGARTSIVTNDASIFSAFYCYDDNDGGSGAYGNTILGHGGLSRGLHVNQDLNVIVPADKIGIGTTAPASLLDVQGTAQIGGIPDAIGDVTASLQVEGTSKDTSAISIFRNTDGGGAPAYLLLGKSRGGAVGADTIVQDGDQVGIIRFAAADGTDRYSAVAEIRSEVGGTPGTNDTPGELIFSTTPDGAQAVAERIRIMADGKIGIGTSVPVTDLTIDGTITLKEQASADADTAAYGQIWVKSDAPNSLYFTGDTGVDQALASTGKAIAMAIVFGG